jgi:hypothetical protein
VDTETTTTPIARAKTAADAKSETVLFIVARNERSDLSFKRFAKIRNADI